MADNQKAVGGGSLTHTLHVWPTPDLIAESAYWPEWWYPAYERAARELAGWAASWILGGLPDCTASRMELQPCGSLTFSVRLSGTTIDVVVSEFEGPEDPEPDAPGPNGGVRRTSADGLVLGLRGTGKSFSMHTFYNGPVSSVQAGRTGQPRPLMPRISPEVSDSIRSPNCSAPFSFRIAAVLPAAARPAIAQPIAQAKAAAGAVRQASVLTLRPSKHGPAKRSAMCASTLLAPAAQPGARAEICRPDRIDAAPGIPRVLAPLGSRGTGPLCASGTGLPSEHQRAAALPGHAGATRGPDPHFCPARPAPTGAIRRHLH